MNFIQEDSCIFLLDEQAHRIAEITFPSVDGIYHLNPAFVDACLRVKALKVNLWKW